METTVEKPVNYRKKRVNYALAATLVTAGLSYAEAAEQTGAANGESLRRGLARKGVTARHVRKLPVTSERMDSVTTRVAVQAAEKLRDSIGDRLMSQVQKLSSKPVGRLANDGQGEAAVLKTLAETHKTLYGGADSINIVFGVQTVQDAGDPMPIEMQAEVVKATDNP